MAAMCLNTKNPEVAKLLQDYTTLLGSEDAAKYILGLNNGYALDKDSNGNPSPLFERLLKENGNDLIAAITAKAKLLEKSRQAEEIGRFFNENPALQKGNSIVTFVDFIDSVYGEESMKTAMGVNINDFNTSAIDTSRVDVEFVDKPWRTDSTKSNRTVRIYLKDDHNKGYFELVKDNEYGYFSVHFKTAKDKPTDTASEVSTKEERSILFQELVKAIPAGARVSTWGELTEDGIRGLNNVGRNMTQVDKRSAKRKGDKKTDIEIPVFQNVATGTTVDTFLFDLSSNAGVLAYNKWVKKQNEIAEAEKSEAKSIFDITLPERESIPKEMIEITQQIKDAIKLRIKSFEHSALHESKQIDILEALYTASDNVEEYEAIFEFVQYALDDCMNTVDTLKTMYAKYKNWEKTKEGPCPVSSTDLEVIRKGTVGFYNSLMNNIQMLLNDPDVMKIYSDMMLGETLNNSVKAVISSYSEMLNLYKDVSNKVVKNAIIEYARKAGSFTIDELEQKLQEGDTDLNFWDAYIGQAQYCGNEIFRQVLNKITTAKYRVHDHKISVARRLINLLNKCKRSDVELFFERDRDGKRTGNFVTALNFGQHEQDYQKHMLEWLKSKKIDIPEGTLFSHIPSILNQEQFKEWTNEKLEWDAKHSEMRYTPGYYKLMNSLSPKAKEVKDNLDRDINDILSKCRDEKGFPHFERLTEEQYNQYLVLRNRRANLSSFVYPNGVIKTGEDLELAKEFAAYQKELNKQRSFVKNEDRWKADRAKAKAELSPEEFALWAARNSQEVINSSFYDDVAKLAAKYPKTDQQKALETYRKLLLKHYKLSGKLDPTLIPSDVREKLAQVDRLIFAEMKKAISSATEKSHIDEIAEWQVDPNFYVELSSAKAAFGPEQFAEWVRQNGYYGKGRMIYPNSMWKRLVPKKEFREKYVDFVPNSNYYEIDKNSSLYNPNFDESYNVARVPKKSLYDNSKNYNKIKGNAKVLYDALREVMRDELSKIFFRHKQNNVMLPQIRGRLMEILTAKDNVFKKLGYAFEDTFSVNDNDVQFNTETALNPDGTKVRLVPTRYMIRLDDPEFLTHDLVGSVILFAEMAENFRQMTQIAPEMEQTLDFIQEQKLRDSKGNLVTGQSKLFKRAEDLIEAMIYGMSEKPYEVNVTVGKKKLRISISKVLKHFATYTRVRGMGNNASVILTGMFTNKVGAWIEAQSRMYYSKKDYVEAKWLLEKEYLPALMNLGTAKNNTPAIACLEFCGVGRNTNEQFGRLDQNRLMRALSTKFFFGGFEIADITSKAPVVIAIFKCTRYDPSTNRFYNRSAFMTRFRDEKKWDSLKLNLWDCMEMKDGVFQVKEEYKGLVDEQTLTKVRNTAKQICTRIDTQLSDLDRSFATANTITKMFFIFRNFIPVNLQTKFITKRGYDYSTESWQEGQYRGAINWIQRHWFGKNIVELQALYKEHYDSLDYFEQQLAKRCAWEVGFCVIGMYLLCALTMAIADDDRDNELKQFLALITLRSSMELRTNVIPIETMNLIKSPTPAWNIVTEFQSLIKDLSEMSLLEKIKSGKYRGMSRFERSLIKLSPFKNVYEFGNSRSKMKYYDNILNAL